MDIIKMALTNFIYCEPIQHPNVHLNRMIHLHEQIF